MKKTGLICLLFTLCCFTGSIAFSDTISYSFKVATVNIPQVIGYSKDIKTLKENNKVKTEELANFIIQIKENLQSETDIKKRKNLEEKYNEKLRQKKATLTKQTIRKIDAMDKKIKNKIAHIAKKQGFNLVLSQNAVLYGGENITNEVISK